VSACISGASKVHVSNQLTARLGCATEIGPLDAPCLRPFLEFRCSIWCGRLGGGMMVNVFFFGTYACAMVVKVVWWYLWAGGLVRGGWKEGLVTLVGYMGEVASSPA
jgi:hypothetical protein